MRRTALLLVALALVCSGAAAQSGGEQDRLSGKIAFGYLATSGNTESTSTNGSLSVAYRRESWRHGFETSAVAASTGDQTTAEAYLLAYEGRREFGEHHYLFMSLDFKRDRFSGYPEQISETIGYGRRLMASGAHVLDGGIGLGVRQSELRNGVEERDSIVRGAMDYSWTMTDSAELEQSLTVESGATNTMLESRSALRARIVGNLSLVLSFRFKRNSAVPAGTSKEDRFSSIALEYAF